MIYYQHNQTKPLRKHGFKMKLGDEYIEHNNGSYEFLRNGELVIENVVGPESVIVVEDEIEADEDEELNVYTMDKHDLEKFALEKFNVDLDRRNSLSKLREEVLGLIKGDING